MDWRRKNERNGGKEERGSNREKKLLYAFQSTKLSKIVDAKTTRQINNIHMYVLLLVSKQRKTKSTMRAIEMGTE